MRRLLVLAVAGAALAGCTAGDDADVRATGATDSALPDGRVVTVTRVVDGDTIVVDGDESVRLIGIDTPETRDPRRPVACFGREATAATEELLPPGTEVVLEADVESVDRYDRTLAYVHRVDDGRFVNLALVAGGWAAVATYPPNVRHVDRFLDAQAAARSEGQGLWSACGAVDVPVDEAGPTTTAAAGGGGGDDGGCLPAYPTLCLPATPDLDCADLDERRFRVLPPDPHRLDGNGDGIGCEG